MEGGESILDSIYDDDNIEDIEMLDIEEGECVPRNEQEQCSGADVNVVNGESRIKNCRRRKKKKNRKRKGGPASHVEDINRFVSETCKRLKEKKSYMVYTAVGCLGVSALRDLIKEVDAIQACGGQMTSDGRRHRTGGGVLWSIIKAREPKAYKEIMKRAQEFERQFRQQNIRQEPKQNKGASQESTHGSTDQTTGGVSDGSELVPQIQNHPGNSNGEDRKRVSVHNRIRVPVSYDDLLGEEDL